MLSYSDLLRQCQDETRDSSTEAIAFFGRNINIGLKIVEAEFNSYFIEDTNTITTVADTYSYQQPVDYRKLKAAYITISDQEYPITEIHSENEWRSLRTNTTATSNIPTHVFARNATLEFYPTPSDDGDTITLIYEAVGKSLANADYTTGTITTLATAGTAVTASGTTFTSAMIGRYFKVDADTYWYKITAVPTTTTLTLQKAYRGTSIVAGTEAYTIGEMSRLPEASQHLPALYTVWRYWRGYKKSPEMARDAQIDFIQQFDDMKVLYGSRYANNYIPPKKLRYRIVDPNLYPTMTS